VLALKGKQGEPSILMSYNGDSNSRFVAAISISRALCCKKRPGRYGNRDYIWTFSP